MTKSFEIKPFGKEGRFAIFSTADNQILDDAQGYGYKTKQKALKAAYWKFAGGKEKRSESNKIANEFLKKVKRENGLDISKELDRILLENAKYLMIGDVTDDDIWRYLEEEGKIQIAPEMRKAISKYLRI